MTELLQIDPDARLEAVRRQLAGLRKVRVLVEIPKGWRELDNAARMRLLQRQAQFQRCELGLITRNEEVRKAASQVGIPVFGRAEDAEGRAWRMDPLLPLVDSRRPAAALPDPPPWRRNSKNRRTTEGRTTELNRAVEQMARPTHHQARQNRIRSEARYRQPLPAWLRLVGYSALGALLILVLAGFTFYILPAATITLTPGHEQVAVNVSLTANPDLTEPDFVDNLLPARLIETTIVLTGTIPTTGSQQRSTTDKAAGTVVFSNLGSTPVNIPAGTVVSTGTGTPVSFRTITAAEVAGGVGQRVTVPIEAVEEGVSGNVRANTINTVEGAMRFRVSVSNPIGTGGGSAQLTSVVTQADRDNLLAQLQSAVEARAVETLQQKLEVGEWLPPETVQTFVMAQEFSAFNDEEANELSLDLRTLLRGVAVNEADTRTVLLNTLEEVIPEGGKLVADSFTMQRLPGVTAIDRSVAFTMAVTADYVAPIDPAEVRALITGLPPDVAVAAIQSRWRIARPPEIHQDPTWFGTLPRLGRRIQVRVVYEGE